MYLTDKVCIYFLNNANFIFKNEILNSIIVFKAIVVSILQLLDIIT